MKQMKTLHHPDLPRPWDPEEPFDEDDLELRMEMLEKVVWEILESIRQMKLLLRPNN